MYTKDQWAVMVVLAMDAPKRTKMKVSQIAAKAFGDEDGSDRRARNAFRKPRAHGHLEIADRGEYRLTAEGLSYYKQATKEGTEPDATRVSKKKDVPKVAKKADTKKATKKAKKAATKKTAAKKAPAKKAKKTAAKKAKKATTKKATTKKAAAKKAAAKKTRARKGKPDTPVVLSF